jgi:putative transposase
MRYRRADVAGGTYFFTVNLAERKRTLLVDHVDVLRKVIRKMESAHPFHIDAMVILPDHLHALWTLPTGDYDYPTHWMLIQAGFSPGFRKVSGAATAASPRANGASGNGAFGST